MNIRQNIKSFLGGALFPSDKKIFAPKALQFLLSLPKGLVSMTITNGDQDKRVNLFRLIIFFHFFLSVSNFNLIFFNLTLHKQRVFSFSFLSMRIKSLKFYNGQKTSGNWQQLNIF